VAAAWGWRTIYLASAVLMVMLSVLLARMLPRRVPELGGSYPQLMLSTLRLVREEPTLRRRAACQALLFGAFSCFWTSVAFELIQRHHLGQVGIGIFALVGAATSFCWPWPASCLTSPSRATRSSASGRSTNCAPTPGLASTRST
jgi:predicted MFS family arabinose efflux permease